MVEGGVKGELLFVLDEMSKRRTSIRTMYGDRRAENTGTRPEDGESVQARRDDTRGSDVRPLDVD